MEGLRFGLSYTMQAIEDKKFNKRIEKDFVYKFSIAEFGIYLIEVTASAKSWYQNLIRFVSFFKDDDLAVKIDGRSFPKLDGRRGLFDGEAAWNGNNLKGLSKTNAFFISLEEGEHELYFFAEQSPTLESIRVYNIGEQIGQREVSYVPSNNPPQEGNRRQWLTLVLVDQALESLRITAKVHEGKSFLLFKRDDSDIKIIIDGKIQKNEEPKSHIYWYWCGRTLKGNNKTFSKELNLPGGLHYIEFWADRRPTIEGINLLVGDTGGNVERQKAKVVWEHAVLREKPNQKSKVLIAKINKNSTVAILEKAIRGERPINEKNNEEYLSDRWHFVEYENTSGYIFSMALEIEGEDEKTIKHLVLKKSEELNEDPCLMLAIAKRESQFSPYMVSSENAQGIFQLKEAAVTDVNKEFGKNFDNRFDVNQNIEAGILYFQMVKKRYKGRDNFWERCLAAWNRGWGRVPVGEPFLMEAQPIATQQFIQDVFTFWEGCKNKVESRGKLSLLLMLVIGIIGVVVLALLNVLLLKEPYPIPSMYQDHVILTEEKIDVNKDGVEEKLIAVNDAPDSTFGLTRIIVIEKDGSFVELPDYGGELQWVRAGDFNKNGKTDIAVLYGYSGSAGFGVFYLYEWHGDDFTTLISREEISAETYFKDLDGDGAEEILFTFRQDKWGKEMQDIYRWDQESSQYITL